MEKKYYEHKCPCGNRVEIKVHHKHTGVPKACKSGHSGLVKKNRKLNSRLQEGYRLYQDDEIYTCICGCGKEIKLKKHHQYTGVPQYINGHNPTEISEEGRRKISEMKKGKLRTEKEKKAISEGTKLALRRHEVKINFENGLKNREYTNLKKYGTTHIWNRQESKEKRKCTNVKKYGVEFPLENFEVQNKIRSKKLENFYNLLIHSDRLKNLVKPLFSLKEYINKNMYKKYSKYKFQCVKCDNVFEDHLDNGKIPRCLNCYPICVSKYENEIYDWLCNLNILNIQKRNRGIIKPLELDIYLPDFKLAIEFNGLWSHSEIGGGKDKNYHLNKTNLCKGKGIELLHIFEDEWIEKQDIVKSIIKNKLDLTTNKIYARDCIIKEVDKEEALLFLMSNHLQDAIICKHFIGLYYKDNIVQLVGIGKPRFNKNYDWELIRMCNKIDTIVIGGFNKLMNYAVDKLGISSIVSYVDKRYFNGKGYKDWTLLNESKPNYFYTKDYQIREGRIKYQKHKIVEKEEDKNLTEWTLMQLKGYDRIWDVGNKVFEKRIH